MADTIRRRLVRPDPFLDNRLEPARDCARRAWCRAELRRAFTDPAHDTTALAARLMLPQASLDSLLQQPYFGAAWEAVETAAPALRRRLVAVTDLPDEMAAARVILRQNAATDPADQGFWGVVRHAPSPSP